VQNIRVEVTDRDGWRKEFVLQKVINHVGVDARNDIVLESAHGGGVAPRHLQIIASGDTCRVVNVGNMDITIATGFDPATTAPTQVRPLPQLSSTDVMYGAWIKLGDFTVRMRLVDQIGYTAPAVPMQATEQAAGAVAAGGVSTPPATPPTTYSRSLKRRQRRLLRRHPRLSLAHRRALQQPGRMCQSATRSGCA